MFPRLSAVYCEYFCNEKKYIKISEKQSIKQCFRFSAIYSSVCVNEHSK